MDNIKISATFVLPGRTIDAKNSIFKTETIRGKGLRPINIQVSVPKPAQQNMRMTEEAYQEFINTPIPGMGAGFWKSLNNRRRVKMHLLEVAAAIGGKLDSFEILND